METLSFGSSVLIIALSCGVGALWAAFNWYGLAQIQLDGR